MRFILRECFENTEKGIRKHPTVAHLSLKSMFNKPQTKPNDRSVLRECHQQIKLNITWLPSLGYKTQ